MQQIYALRIATKDRPVVFQRIVFSLFLLALVTVVFCVYAQVTTAKPGTVKTAYKQETTTERNQQWFQASFAGKPGK